MEDVRLAPVRRQKSGTAATAFICIIFGILAFALSLCSAVQLIARNVLEKSVISNTVSDMNPADWELGMFWNKKDIEDFVKEWYFPRSINADSTFAEAIKDTCLSVGQDVTTDDVRQMFEETGIMPSLGGLIVPYERYLLTGEDEKIFSPELIMNKIKEQHDSVQESIGLDISIFYELIEVGLYDVEPAFDDLNPAALTGSAGVYISAAVSVSFIVITIALSLVMFAIALIITKHFAACLRMYGIALLIAGAASAAAVPALPVLLREGTPLRYNAVDYIDMEFNAAFAPIFLTVGGIFAGIGTLLIVISIIVSAVSKKKSAKTPQTTA